MRVKIIWSCWLCGRRNAPPHVSHSLNSWKRNNEGWEFRCLDAMDIERYVPLADHFDLRGRSITDASLLNIVSVLLLHEFGGVWVDATLSCEHPLDEWLPGCINEGFFAFAGSDADRPVFPGFLAAEPGHPLVSAWARRTVAYWAGRTKTDNPFWFAHLFRDLYQTDPSARMTWSRVAKICEGQRPISAARAEADEPAAGTVPVLESVHSPALEPRPASPGSFASLKVSTENVGDHVQIVAGLRLLSRLHIRPTRYIDRDDEIQTARILDDADSPVGILLNGWFKTNRQEWPPHCKLIPLIYGFHIRLFQCPELLSDRSIDFFRRFEPIGCRDICTESLLRAKGVEAFTSNCLSLMFSRRVDDPVTQTETFVVSRDDRIKALLPAAVGPYRFISHYSGSNDFASNMARAEQLLGLYRARARLIITTLLHCALPAIAMGIPVIVFYPLNGDAGHASDRERFSSLERLIRVYRFDEMSEVHWNPARISIGDTKLSMLDRFYELAAARWGLPSPC